MNASSRVWTRVCALKYGEQNNLLQFDLKRFDSIVWVTLLNHCQIIRDKTVLMVGDGLNISASLMRIGEFWRLID